MAALDQLTAISPLDGRYGSKVEALREVFSEYGLVKRRVAVECAWLAALCAHPGIPECPPLAADEAALLDGIAANFSVADARKFSRSTDSGVICTNPPYGERLMDRQAAGELYRAFGKALRATSGWRVCVLSSHEQFESCFGARASKRRRLYNGTIPCQLFIYDR